MAKKLYTDDLIDMIDNNGKDAYTLLFDADKSFEKRFKEIDKSLIALLKDVRKYFPDAQYYTGSGGFNLIIGDTHHNGVSCQQLVALCGNAQIVDGDF